MGGRAILQYGISDGDRSAAIALSHLHKLHTLLGGQKLAPRICIAAVGLDISDIERHGCARFAAESTGSAP